MGSGVSKKPPDSGKGSGKGKSGLSLALLRRRRLLFQSDTPRTFEAVAPRQQYTAAPEAGDPVFERLQWGIVEANSIRQKAFAIQYHNDVGYLGEHAIELLGLGLVPGSVLSRRLFRLAQAQDIQPGPRRPQMTCYELLALYSLLKAGSAEELLELLFCVFDADGDDRIGIEDLSVSIDGFLQLQEAAAHLSAAEQKEFKMMNERTRREEARRLAEEAVRVFSKEDSEDEEESAEAVKGAEASPADSANGKTAEGENTDSAAATSIQNEDEKTEPAERSLQAPSIEQAEAAAKAKAQAKAKPKPKASMSCFSFGGAKKNQSSGLSFRQWQQWLLASQLLPVEMEPVLAAALAAKPAPEPRTSDTPSTPPPPPTETMAPPKDPDVGAGALPEVERKPPPPNDDTSDDEEDGMDAQMREPLIG